MSLRLYLLIAAGVLLDLLLIGIIVDPITLWPPTLRHRFLPVGQVQALDPSRRVLLPTSATDGWFRLCTRSSPWPIGAEWRPTKAMLDTLDVDLVLLLSWVRSIDKDVKGHPAGRVLLKDFRQYLGLVPLGRDSIILVAGFSPDEMPPIGVTNWRRDVVDVCDGGDSHWSVEYDPRSRMFTMFSYGGG